MYCNIFLTNACFLSCFPCCSIIPSAPFSGTNPPSSSSRLQKGPPPPPSPRGPDDDDEEEEEEEQETSWTWRASAPGSASEEANAEEDGRGGGGREDLLPQVRSLSVSRRTRWDRSYELRTALLFTVRFSQEKKIIYKLIQRTRYKRVFSQLFPWYAGNPLKLSALSNFTLIGAKGERLGAGKFKHFLSPSPPRNSHGLPSQSAILTHTRGGVMKLSRNGKLDSPLSLSSPPRTCSRSHHHTHTPLFPSSSSSSVSAVDLLLAGLNPISSVFSPEEEG